MTKALVITAPGINCDLELAEAFALAGATPFYAHINELMEDPSIIDQADLIGFPGGFSYGDAVAAGRIMANLMRDALYPKFVEALKRGVPMIAPCNGLQIAVQLGLLPGPKPGSDWSVDAPRPTVALAQNESARVIVRWVEFHVPSNTRCIWTKNISFTKKTSVIPIAHGEGRFVPENEEILRELEESGRIACRYGATDNPNGSVGDVMGICDASGLVLGLMPHPERYLRWTQHPTWTRLSSDSMASETVGLQMFRNAVSYVQKKRTTEQVEPVVLTDAH
ncbi:MAG: phosphoribosylformylglycinamidine synthase subunit PurQ [Planctomycetota bacterium]|nr:phosphoribosylformylglycinamidine synthase subunit PurQ [Planctomycetota bacterium]